MLSIAQQKESVLYSFWCDILPDKKLLCKSSSLVICWTQTCLMSVFAACRVKRSAEPRHDSTNLQGSFSTCSSRPRKLTCTHTHKSVSHLVFSHLVARVVIFRTPKNLSPKCASVLMQPLSVWLSVCVLHTLPFVCLMHCFVSFETSANLFRISDSDHASNCQNKRFQQTKVSWVLIV